MGWTFLKLLRHCDSIERNKHKEFLLFEERINLNKLLTGATLFFILIKYYETNSIIMGYHEYQEKWDAVISKVSGRLQKRRYCWLFAYRKNRKICQNDISFSKVRDVVYLQSKVTGKRTDFEDDKGL